MPATGEILHAAAAFRRRIFPAPWVRRGADLSRRGDPFGQRHSVQRLSPPTARRACCSPGIPVDPFGTKFSIYPIGFRGGTLDRASVRSSTIVRGRVVAPRRHRGRRSAARGRESGSGRATSMSPASTRSRLHGVRPFADRGTPATVPGSPPRAEDGAVCVVGRRERHAAATIPTDTWSASPSCAFSPRRALPRRRRVRMAVVHLRDCGGHGRRDSLRRGLTPPLPTWRSSAG